MKKELHEFTSEELLRELKRRLEDSGAMKGKKASYAVVEGTVVRDSELPLCRRKYRVSYKDAEGTKEGLFKLIGGKFRLETAPREGDRVLLRTRLTKSCTGFTPSKALLVDIVKRGGK